MKRLQTHFLGLLFILLGASPPTANANIWSVSSHLFNALDYLERSRWLGNTETLAELKIAYDQVVTNEERDAIWQAMKLVEKTRNENRKLVLTEQNLLIGQVGSVLSMMREYYPAKDPWSGSTWLFQYEALMEKFVLEILFPGVTDEVKIEWVDISPRDGFLLLSSYLVDPRYAKYDPEVAQLIRKPGMKRTQGWNIRFVIRGPELMPDSEDAAATIKSLYHEANVWAKGQGIPLEIKTVRTHLGAIAQEVTLTGFQWYPGVSAFFRNVVALAPGNRFLFALANSAESVSNFFGTAQLGNEILNGVFRTASEMTGGFESVLREKLAPSWFQPTAERKIIQVEDYSRKLHAHMTKNYNADLELIRKSGGRHPRTDVDAATRTAEYQHQIANLEERTQTVLKTMAEESDKAGPANPGKCSAELKDLNRLKRFHAAEQAYNESELAWRYKQQWRDIEAYWKAKTPNWKGFPKQLDFLKRQELFMPTPDRVMRLFGSLVFIYEATVFADAALNTKQPLERTERMLDSGSHAVATGLYLIPSAGIGPLVAAADVLGLMWSSADFAVYRRDFRLERPSANVVRWLMDESYKGFLLFNHKDYFSDIVVPEVEEQFGVSADLLYQDESHANQWTTSKLELFQKSLSTTTVSQYKTDTEKNAAAGRQYKEWITLSDAVAEAARKQLLALLTITHEFGDQYAGRVQKYHTDVELKWFGEAGYATKARSLLSAGRLWLSDILVNSAPLFGMPEP